MTPTPETMLVRSTVFDLEAFDDAYLGKKVTKPTVANMSEALALVGGDNAALLDVVRTGLIERARDEAKKDTAGWYYMSDGNPNEMSDKVFTGVMASSKGVNQTIMTLAKTMFGYISGRGISAEQKTKNDAAKTKAETLVKNNEDIREGLKAQALDAD